MPDTGNCLLPQRPGAAREQHSAEEKAAIKLLKKRVQDLGRGVIGTWEERVTFERLTEDLKKRASSLAQQAGKLFHLPTFRVSKKTTRGKASLSTAIF
jgi:hypothetical protein